eukprot:Platyproteum_vivax@DN1941_c0_g1_i2.p1
MKYIFGLVLFVLVVSSYSLRENASRAVNRKMIPLKAHEVKDKQELQCESKCKDLEDCLNKCVSKDGMELCWDRYGTNKRTYALCPTAKCNIKAEFDEIIKKYIKDDVMP